MIISYTHFFLSHTPGFCSELQKKKRTLENKNKLKTKHMNSRIQQVFYSTIFILLR